MQTRGLCSCSHDSVGNMSSGYRFVNLSQNSWQGQVHFQTHKIRKSLRQIYRPRFMFFVGKPEEAEEMKRRCDNMGILLHRGNELTPDQIIQKTNVFRINIKSVGFFCCSFVNTIRRKNTLTNISSKMYSRNCHIKWHLNLGIFIKY